MRVDPRPIVQAQAARAPAWPHGSAFRGGSVRTFSGAAKRAPGPRTATGAGASPPAQRSGLSSGPTSRRVLVPRPPRRIMHAAPTVVTLSNRDFLLHDFFRFRAVTASQRPRGLRLYSSMRPRQPRRCNCLARRSSAMIGPAQRRLQRQVLRIFPFCKWACFRRSRYQSNPMPL